MRTSVGFGTSSGIANCAKAAYQAPEQTSAPDIAERQVEVASQVNELGNELIDLAERIDTLRVRLSPVISSRLKATESEPQKPECILCPLANEIRNHVKSVQCLRNGIAELLGSLEI